MWRGLKNELELRRRENPFLMAEGEGEETFRTMMDYDDYGMMKGRTWWLHSHTW